MQTRDLLSLIAWEVVNPALLQVKRRRVYDFNGRFRGINLGCGIDTPAGWIGVDGGITHVFARSMPRPIVRIFFRGFRMATHYSVEDYTARLKAVRVIHHDLRFGVPFRTASVPNVYSSHFVEHLTQPDADHLLRECHRVMQPGGRIRICVPSLDREADKMRSALAAYERGDVQPIQQWVTDRGSGFVGPYSRHRRMYNVAELSTALTRAGFVEPTERRFREGAIADVDQLDTRPGIYVEAQRP